MMITLKQISAKTGIPQSTAARYTVLFMEYFPRKKDGRKLLFLEVEALETAQRIQRLYKDGKTTDQVHGILEKERTAVMDALPFHILQ